MLCGLFGNTEIIRKRKRSHSKEKLRGERRERERTG